VGTNERTDGRSFSVQGIDSGHAAEL